MKINVQKYLAMHDSVVKDILDKTDMPFAFVDTHWFRKGQSHKYKGKWLKIECEEPILISSYVDTGDGRYIRISNHKKKGGLGKGYIEYIYDWQNGKVLKGVKSDPEEII